MTFRKKIKLPIWLKVFSGEPAAPSLEELERIADALKLNKSVILLINGEPVKICVVNSKVTISKIKDYKWCLGY